MSAHLDPRVLARLKRDSAGLFPAIAQQYDTGEVLMLGWMDDRALHSTLTTGRCTYFSRSRQEYWVKGDTSGHVQLVKSVALDCDADTVLVQVDQSGGACHTGARTCFDDDVLLAEGLTDSAGMAVASVDEAIARMQSIDDTVGPRDGVGRFNRMYLEVTRSVRASLHQGLFFGPEFVARLDVALANLYFEAVAAEREPAEVPLAWRPLVEQRDRAGIEPIQFALAGVSAHISHDLPLAVVSVCAELETEPSASPHRRDYQMVVELLDAAEQSIRRRSESPAELSFDRHLAAAKNVVGNWSTGAARDLAWRNALLLWRLRDDAAARALFTDGLANAAALAGRLLLAAV